MLVIIELYKDIDLLQNQKMTYNWKQQLQVRSKRYVYCKWLSLSCYYEHNAWLIVILINEYS